MKKLFSGLIIALLSLPVLLALIIVVALQTQQMSRSDLQFLVDLGKREGLGAVVSVIRSELYGVEAENASDPGYGRELVPGRGNAPWVIRGNLDGRPRMLKFALAPGYWAAYDVQHQSLYQVWQGAVLFEGAAYNYQHGPQPSSEGAWYLRDTAPARWFIVVDGEEQPARVRYLGHAYGPQRATAHMRFELRAGDVSVTLTEQPELEERAGTRVFLRRFDRELPGPEAGFYDAGGTRHMASGVIEIPLTASTAIQPAAAPTRGRDPDANEVERGQAIIAGSDCLGCHAAGHRVSGPAWSQISGKFRGKVQDEVVEVLANHVREGVVGVWGQVPMPPHPQLSEQDARLAVTYILSVGEPEQDAAPPLDADGKPYPATREFDTLPRLTAVHPSFTLENVAPDGFEPKVGGMDFRPDGKLVVASWDLDGAVYLIQPDAPAPARVRRIAEGLHEPLGLSMVGDRLFVLQKQELTELIDTDGDDIIDRYDTISDAWPASANFHSFAFGLLPRDDNFYFLLSICVLPGGASCPEQLPTQGKLLRTDLAGNTDIVASGFRTPNGIGVGADGAIYVTDNQGDWLPASKLLRISPGGFYGSRAVPDADIMDLQELPPSVWLPQDEVGNSPTQPLALTEGPYAGQMIHGDVYNGGIKRVFLEQVAGQEQGAAFHFSAGFQGAVNRLLRGPDGAIYVGEVGNPPNWGEYGKPWHGLERLRWQGNNAFEILAVRIRQDGFEIELTQPLAENLQPRPDDLLVKQWFYHPNEQYGGPKYNETALPVAALTLSADRRRLQARIAGLSEGHVVYLRLDDRLRSARDDSLWTAEAWYTLNRLPAGAVPGEQVAAAQPDGTAPAGDADGGPWRTLFDGRTLEGWRNYGSAGPVRKWRVEDGTLSLAQEGVFPLWDLIRSVLFGGGSGDLIYHREKFTNFELSLQWKIAGNGNSGIFYLVADEEEKTPWLTGLEMQVLDNDGHGDVRIETHRAGDLYDLIAADPETVRAPGHWNDVRIRVQDNHIEHWLNGVKVLEVTRASEEWDALVAASKFADMPRFGRASSGYIVLQDHGDRVWYRNIRVRDLPAQ
ncbi:MAG: DUF1080 domain-containing protein [Halioglobus sp.]|nr:DUF1080 domain-containing protein [Halioglobus sp.]